MTVSRRVGASSSPRIALTVNHPQRDLAGVVLTARALCRQGATCFITPANLQEWELWALAPDFVVLHYARRGIDELASRLAAAGIGFGVLDAEGGIWESFEAYDELLWADRALLSRARPFCAWGPLLANHLVEAGLLTAPQVALTGCPRFDFYHDDWRPVLVDDERDEPPRILINTNFSMVNPRFVTAERNRANMMAVYGWTAGRVDLLLERERRAIQACIDMARRLAADFAHCAVVVRPHPFEGVGVYADGLRDTRVAVEPDGPVQLQIARAALVIQRSCTTAAEAAFAGVPTLSPQWIEPPFLMPVAEEISTPCDGYDDLRATAAAILDHRWQAPPSIAAAITRVTAGWFHAIDGQAHRRAADAIMAQAASPTVIDQRACSRHLYGLGINGLRQLTDVGRWTRLRLGLNPDWSFRHMRRVRWSEWDRSDKAFTAADVARLASRIDRVARAAEGTTVAVTLAKEAGECSHGYDARSVRMACT
jgi:surface carbohydrate biosynthesis protein